MNNKSTFSTHFTCRSSICVLIGYTLLTLVLFIVPFSLFTYQMQYKILSLTHKSLHSGLSSYLRSLLNLKQSWFTHSSHLLALQISLTSKSLAFLSLTLFLLYGTRFLLIFERSHTIIHHQHLRWPCLHLSSTKNLKLIFFTGLFLLSHSPSSTTDI